MTDKITESAIDEFSIELEPAAVNVRVEVRMIYIELADGRAA